jgi:hypothetical protein
VNQRELATIRPPAASPVTPPGPPAPNPPALEPSMSTPAQALPPSTADEMRQALYRHFAPRQAVLFEIATDWRTEPGADAAWPRTHQRRIDVLVVQRARKAEHGSVDLLAIEIKIARSDFLADVRDPAKQARWREATQRHAYAVPSGLVQRDEVPAGSGLLTVGARHPGAYYWPVTWETRAPRNGERMTLPTWLILAFAHRASGAEAQVRGITGSTEDTAGQSAQELRGALIEARNRADLLTRQLHDAREQISEWRTVFAAQGHLPCAYCGQPCRPRSVRGGRFNHWGHVNRAHDEPCEAIRRQAEPRYPPPVEPADVQAPAATGRAS